MGDEFNPLTHDILCKCLSRIEPAVGGGGFAFTRLDCSEEELQRLELPALTHLGNKIEKYKQLRHIVLSGNKFGDIIALAQLPHLLTLKLGTNAITAVDMEAFVEQADLPWCQHLDLSANQVSVLPPLGILQRLRFLNLAGQTGDVSLTSLQGFGGHPTLEELQLQENQIASLAGLGTLAALKRLNMTSNQLTSLEGLDAPVLTILEVNENKLTSLEHVGGAPACVELNAAGNEIGAEATPEPVEEGEEEVAPIQREEMADLKILSAETPALRVLKIDGPAKATLGEMFRANVLILMPNITQIDEDPVIEEDQQAVKDELARLEELANPPPAEEEDAEAEDGE